ncbi:alpha/beta fold hydrolase [Alishewanella sp. SMS8]|uniref:alpha/beta fold hydrolase n=1 Tax=Alishewanella sp. SMS8 TaxID=2994676 RepID=UPI002742139B|nr:alpha/beta hydrolase [Alishewanella sp. SMS8]MDP5460472.1 alpha/beta hydrolase [Alishewanella sp. SMS8]
MKFILLSIFVLSFSVVAEPKFSKVGDFELEYEIAGSGEYTVLLEGGAGAGLSDWDPVFYKIAEKATVIRYSRVGNGNSTAIKRHFTSDEYAHYASNLLLNLGISQPVILIAHSYGGNVARDFAVTYPAQIKALLMLDPSSEHDVDIMRAINLEQANKEIAAVKLADMENGMSNNYLDFWSKRPLPNYPQIKDMPVTVIASIKKDPNPPHLLASDQGVVKWGETWKQWAEAFPQGRAVLTEMSGHFVQFDEPELVISELTLIIERLIKH